MELATFQSVERVCHGKNKVTRQELPA